MDSIYRCYISILVLFILATGYANATTESVQTIISAPRKT